MMYTPASLQPRTSIRSAERILGKTANFGFRDLETALNSRDPKIRVSQAKNAFECVASHSNHSSIQNVVVHGQTCPQLLQAVLAYMELPRKNYSRPATDCQVSLVSLVPSTIPDSEDSGARLTHHWL